MEGCCASSALASALQSLSAIPLAQGFCAHPAKLRHSYLTSGSKQIRADPAGPYNQKLGSL